MDKFDNQRRIPGRYFNDNRNSPPPYWQAPHPRTSEDSGFFANAHGVEVNGGEFSLVARDLHRTTHNDHSTQHNFSHDFRGSINPKEILYNDHRNFSMKNNCGNQYGASSTVYNGPHYGNLARVKRARQPENSAALYRHWREHNYSQPASEPNTPHPYYRTTPLHSEAFRYYNETAVKSLKPRINNRSARMELNDHWLCEDNAWAEIDNSLNEYGSAYLQREYNRFYDQSCEPDDILAYGQRHASYGTDYLDHEQRNNRSLASPPTEVNLINQLAEEMVLRKPEASELEGMRLTCDNGSATNVLLSNLPRRADYNSGENLSFYYDSLRDV